jgi:hypothetical protein
MLLQSFKREIRPDDWQRFDIYASFVRHLWMREVRGSPVNRIDFGEGVRRQLASRTPAVPLLPNLRTILVWTNHSSLASLFLAPRVHRLELDIYPGEAAALSSLALEIPLRSPNLRSLHLMESGYWKRYHEAEFIHAFNELLKTLQLEEFVCDWFPLSQDMLNAVLGMPDLSKAVIYAEMPDLAHVMHTHPVHEARIRDFSLCAPLFMPSSLPHIISSLPSKLEALSITGHDGRSCNATELTGLISTLVNTCSPEHLTDISIGSRPRDSAYTGAVIEFKMLEPLLQFVYLRRISFRGHPFDFTDAEIKDMALAWPNLEWLTYWQYHYMSPEGLITVVPKTSLRGLLWLATYCRKLHSLTFPFHSSSGAVKNLTEDEMALAEGHCLSSFDVGFSEIECAEEIARFIKRVFPNLANLVFKVREPNALQWKKVQELIQCS